MSEPVAPPRPWGLIAFVVIGTALVALGTIWPFITAWQIHETPAFRASSAFVLAAPVPLQIVGGHPHMESDWFPKGGEKDGHARFRHKLGGDLRKLDVEVILEEHDGAWVVMRAAYEDEGAMHEIAVEGPARAAELAAP